MALSLGANTYNRMNWETSDFPILCQTCLGDNPYMRMIRDTYGKECTICNRPFTVFRWCPGARMRYKKTEVCQTCAKTKNVCQTCLLDLEYGLPVQVRDAALKMQDEMPKSDVNREYYQQNNEVALSKTGGANSIGGKAPNELLLKLARTTPYYKRNRPHICSFWVKGECKRGEECPYRHEMPTDPTDPLANQNIKDRYYGVDDPVADKLLKRAEDMPRLDTPVDKSITTLYAGGLDANVTEQDLRDEFYQFGEIRNISLVAKQGCAFINFSTREGAERAVQGTFNKLIIKGRRLKILWGRSQGSSGPAIGGIDPKLKNLAPVPGLPLPLTAPPKELLQHDFFGLAGPSGSGMPPRPPPPSEFMRGMPPGPPGLRMPMMPMRLPGPAIHYPSQDPQRMGTSRKTREPSDR